MSLDPAVARFVRACEIDIPEELPLSDHRECIRLSLELNFVRFGLPGPASIITEDHHVDVDGGSIRLRLYRPSAEAALPVHVFLHGGGWWQGSIDDRVNDAYCRRLAAEAGLVVAAVDYRLAPEYPFPHGLNDACSALRWLGDHSEQLGLGMGGRSVTVGGNSAGANLAAAITLKARDEVDLPRIAFQVLEVPALDLRYERGEPGESSLIRGLYLPEPRLADLPTASPLLAPDLSGLPPAAIYVAEHDPLRHQGESYARRLRDASVAVELEVGAGGVHGSLLLTRTWPPALTWQLRTAQRLAAIHQSHPIGDR